MSAGDVSKKKQSSGGSSGGASSSGGGSTGKDGGDINLSAPIGQDLTAVHTASRMTYASKTFKPGQGTILADSVEGYYAVFNRGDEVRVLEKGKTTSTVLVNGKTGEVPTDLLTFADDKAYKEWDGYAKAKAPFYLIYRLYDVPTLLKKNTTVRVLDEYNGLAIVKVGSKIGVMTKDQVSTKKISSGGGGGGGSSSGEWTDPVL